MGFTADSDSRIIPPIGIHRRLRFTANSSLPVYAIVTVHATIRVIVIQALAGDKRFMMIILS